MLSVVVAGAGARADFVTVTGQILMALSTGKRGDIAALAPNGSVRI